MKLILVRHGETEWVRQGRYQGSTDVPLNQAGLSQARVLAHLLKKERPLAVYSSELTRARETAKLIGRVCRREVSIDKRLNEISFGKWEGFSHEGIRVRFPRASRQWYSGHWSSKPPGGESLRSLGKRTSEFLSAMTKKYAHENGSCIVVTHGGPIRMFLIHLLDVSPQLFWTFCVDPASISVVEVSPWMKRLVLWNSLAHLNGLQTRRRQ